MSIRTRLGLSKVLSFGLLLIALWTVVALFNVIELIEDVLALGTSFVAPGPSVGQTAAAGVMGALVLLAFLGLLVVLWGELGEIEPAPEPFDPEE